MNHVKIFVKIKSLRLTFNLLTYLNNQSTNFCLLHSGKPFYQEKNNYHIFAKNPLLILKNNQIINCKNNQIFELNNPLNWMQNTLKYYNLHHFSSKLSTKEFQDFQKLPFSGGFIGFFGYDYKNNLEEKELFNTFYNISPKLYFAFYQDIYIFNTQNCENTFHIIQEIDLKENKFFKVAKSITNNISIKSIEETKSKPISKNLFSQKVQAIKKQILQGNTYQINYSIGYKGKINRSISQITSELFQQNPNPFEGIFAWEKSNFLISTSPEKLFSYNNGEVSSCPIKGSLGKSHCFKENHKRKKELLESSKDIAELAMIVDLIRNDLNKISLPGSVKVTHFKELLSYKNIYHLFANIISFTEQDSVEVFKALFPGGSITGAPKIAACQIIDDLEQESREIYTGSLGYFSFNNKAQFNILIRSILITNYCDYYYKSGSGITLASKEELEYQEIKDKTKIIEEILRK